MMRVPTVQILQTLNSISKIFKIMEKNFVAANEAAPANNLVNNNMETINFSIALGDAAVAQTATVDLQVVSDIYNAFMAIPQEVVVRFRHDNGF